MTERQWYKRELEIMLRNRERCEHSFKSWHRGGYCEDCDHPDNISFYPKKMKDFWYNNTVPPNTVSELIEDSRERCALSEFLFHRFRYAACPLCQNQRYQEERIDDDDDFSDDDDIYISQLQ